jgi:heat shock protein 4
MSVVGIDFGNLNAVIAAARKGGIEILTNEYTYRLTPYVTAIKHGI